MFVKDYCLPVSDDAAPRGTATELDGNQVFNLTMLAVVFQPANIQYRNEMKFVFEKATIKNRRLRLCADGSCAGKLAESVFGICQCVLGIVKRNDESSRHSSCCLSARRSKKSLSQLRQAIRATSMRGLRWPPFTLKSERSSTALPMQLKIPTRQSSCERALELSVLVGTSWPPRKGSLQLQRRTGDRVECH